MDSKCAAQKGLQSEDGRTLAQKPFECVPKDATPQGPSPTCSNDKTRVKFCHHSNNTKDHEEESTSIPELKEGFPSHTQEKPVFPNSVTDPRLSLPLVLSKPDDHTVPYTINRYLRDYQRDGIKFIYNNYIRSRGCILGDDMGLGKTVQVIGFLAAVLHKTGTWEDIENNRPKFLQSQVTSRQIKPSEVFLIVAPLSVLYNWKDELDTWGHFQCVVVHGSKKEEELARMNKGRTEIALTTYETLRLSLDEFNKIRWGAVIVDEAHKIKNPTSQITQAMKALTCKIRIGLTGTILQNNLEELWCVMDWALPGCLGSLGKFKTKFSDPIEQGQKHSATKRALAMGRKTVRVLARKISPWFLRRTKGLIKQQLPKKDDRVVYCSLTDFQQAVYQAVLETDDVLLLLRSSEKCDCQSGRTRRSCCYKTNSEGVQVKGLYFSYLAVLRKVANHVALLQSTAGISKKQEKYVSAVCEKVFQKFPAFVERCKNEAFEALSDPMYSGKMKVLQKLLKHYLQKRDKVLIFSLSTKLLDVLESYCMAEGLDFCRLDGSTNSKQRLQIVKDFNSSPHVNLCLISTMAGGLGLNFVGANIVVLFDPTWNPANDLQAIDRAYRIGQCRDVTVLRLISLGTVEEIIYLRQIYKQQLQSSVVGNESARRYFEAVHGCDVQKGELFGLKNLFRLQTQGTCLTRVILEREGHVEAGVMTTSAHGGEDGEREETKASYSKVPSLALYCGPNDEQTAKNTETSGVPENVLDFSSGSEDEEKQMLKKKAANQREGNATTSPGRTSLLQYGFSKLLENVKEPTDSGGEHSSSEDEGSLIDEAADEQKMEVDTQNAAGSVSNSGGKGLDTTLSSNKNQWKDETSETGSRHNLKRHSNAQIVHEEFGGTSSPELKKASKHKVQLFVCSDESDDFDFQSPAWPKDGGAGKKKQSTRKRDQSRSKYTGDIETFTSSEDEDASSASRDTKERKAKRSKRIFFTNLKDPTSPTHKDKNRNIDSLLGDVQEVTYTHSNQKVVGGSKAEELISRAAIRDVFERKMYSQLPANHLLGIQESLPESLPESPSLSSPHKLIEDHPVTFTSKSMHHTTHTTFIFGETPKAMCRQQLGEMAAMRKCSSVQEFALEILKGTTSQRLTWLQEYYTSLNHPGLASAVTENYPQADSVQANSILTETTSPSGKSSSLPKPKNDSPQNKLAVKVKVPSRNAQKQGQKQKIGQKKFIEALDDPSGLESEVETSCNARELNTKRGSVSPEDHRASGGLGVGRASSSGLDAAEAAAFLSCAHRDTRSSWPLSHGRSTTASKPTAQGQAENLAPSTSGDSSFLTDYLGDVSILDDLFRPNSKSAQQRSSPKTPTATSASANPIQTSRRAMNPNPCEQTSRGSQKDFWDILNEGNEESINRLTDPEEVQRVCINTSFAMRRSITEDGNSLWKTNEKFLWKK